MQEERDCHSQGGRQSNRQKQTPTNDAHEEDRRQLLNHDDRNNRDVFHRAMSIDDRISVTASGERRMANRDLTGSLVDRRSFSRPLSPKLFMPAPDRLTIGFPVHCSKQKYTWLCPPGAQPFGRRSAGTLPQRLAAPSLARRIFVVLPSRAFAGLPSVRYRLLAPSRTLIKW